MYNIYKGEREKEREIKNDTLSRSQAMHKQTNKHEREIRKKMIRLIQSIARYAQANTQAKTLKHKHTREHTSPKPFGKAKDHRDE